MRLISTLHYQFRRIFFFEIESDRYATMASSPTAVINAGETALSSLALGDSLFIDGNYNAAIEFYTSAICLTDDRHVPSDTAAVANSSRANPNSTTSVSENKIIRFRSLTHRSETYLILSLHTHAYRDAKSALDLYVPHDVESRRLRRGELALCHDRAARAALALSRSLGSSSSDGGKDKANANEANQNSANEGFDKDKRNPSAEMLEQAKCQWEAAVALSVIELSNLKSGVGSDSANAVVRDGEVAVVTAALEKYQMRLEELGHERKEGKVSSVTTGVAAPSTVNMATPPPAKSSAAVTPTPANTKDRSVMSGMPKYQYYQDENFMKISILEPNVSPSNLTVTITPDDILIKLIKNNIEYTVIYGDLYEEVVVDKCKTIIKDEKVLIKLKKKEKYDWTKLIDDSNGGDRKKGRVEKRLKAEGKRVDDAKNGKAASSAAGSKATSSEESSTSQTDPQSSSTSTSAPNIPKTNSRTRPYTSHRDWDAIDRTLRLEEENEKPQGDEALNKLFQQIYANANEDTRRAMIKSMQTSGGTVLSTNWDEVSKTDYEKERQAPKGMEWKNYEGKKLPMKEDD